MIKVYKDDSMKETINVIGTDLRIDKKYITIPDMVASFSYFINIIEE
jgi:DNA-directed RNA polymerase subunit beta